MNRAIESYQESFEAAQTVFDGKIDTADRSQLAFSVSAQESADFMTGQAEERPGFFSVVIDSQSLKDDTAKLFINRALLMHNSRLGVLSPAIITEDPEHSGEFQVTMFNQPYDPGIGFSGGMHFAISVKAQTRVEGFGGHGAAGGFEQGHFGAVLLGAKDEAIAGQLVSDGDRATHGVLNGGVSETMTAKQMLDLAPAVTQPLPSDRPVKLQAYWHTGLEGADGPIGGDYPAATRLMLGAGVHAIGDRGLERARGLVNDAIRGAAL